MSAPEMPAGVALTLHGATTHGERKLTWEETRWPAAFATMDDRRSHAISRLILFTEALISL